MLGSAVADAIAEASGLVCALKWPNDVLLAGRKTAGILAEMEADGERVRHVIAGIRVNVNVTVFPPDVSAFTLAHSLTLALATLGGVRLPASLVEPAIAGSVVVAAMLNLVARGGAAERCGLTFTFGLVHGLGFAGALADLEVGTSLRQVLGAPVAFNGGVEAGQMAVAAFVLPLPWTLRRWPVYERAGLRACSLAAALLGCVWLVERTLG